MLILDLDAVPLEAWEKSLVKTKLSGDIENQRKERSPKTNMLDIVGDNRKKAIPPAVYCTKSKKFRVMAEGIGDGSDFESGSSESDNEPGELLAGTVDADSCEC